jgi:hypothetical protein
MFMNLVENFLPKYPYEPQPGLKGEGIYTPTARAKALALYLGNRGYFWGSRTTAYIRKHRLQKYPFADGILAIRFQNLLATTLGRCPSCAPLGNYTNV